jgi:hypothetical protein
MTITNLKSSNIKNLEYNEDVQTLTVEFQNGYKYAYAKVPKFIFISLISAESLGRYLNQNIRGNYSCVRLV